VREEGRGLTRESRTRKWKQKRGERIRAKVRREDKSEREERGKEERGGEVMERDSAYSSAAVLDYAHHTLPIYVHHTAVRTHLNGRIRDLGLYQGRVYPRHCENDPCNKL
jgi:hypothetical protein